MPPTYDQAVRDIRRDIRRGIEPARLAALHRRSGARHALVALGVLGALVGGVAWVLAFGDEPGLWLPGSVAIGFALFACTTLLHEVVHGLVTHAPRPGLRRLLAWVYAVPSGLSATQFTRWHLDHHRWLGTADRDPKRRHLSPKRNARWLKALYLTPALFPIYFRAARRAAASYDAVTRRCIRRERLVAIGFHVGIVAVLGALGGFGAVARLHLVPVFLVFPVAFTVNRLGQHYDVDARDPARWGTLLAPSPWFLDFVFLWSNYHLEHHLFPRVPCYRLPALRRELDPFFRGRGIEARTYGALLRDWFLHNRAPHTDWRPRPARLPDVPEAAGLRR